MSLSFVEQARLAARCSAHQGAPIWRPMGYEADLKLFIDGSWRAGEDRDHFTGRQSSHRRAASPSFLWPPKPTSTKRSPRPRGPGPNGARPTPRSAARSFTRPLDLLRERAEHIGRILTQEQGKILAEAKAEVIGSRAIVRLVCGGDQARLWPHAGPPRGPAVAGHPPAGRPGRDLHAVEFPDLSAGQESRRRARRRLHGDQPPAAGNPWLHRRDVPRAGRCRHSRRASRNWSTARRRWSAPRSSPRR